MIPSRVNGIRLSASNLTPANFSNTTTDTDAFLIEGAQQLNLSGAFSAFNRQRCNDEMMMSNLYALKQNFTSTIGITAGQSFSLGKYNSINLITNDTWSVWSTNTSASQFSKYLGEDEFSFYIISLITQTSNTSIACYIYKILKSTKAYSIVTSTTSILQLLQETPNAYLFGPLLGTRDAVAPNYISLSKVTWTITSTVAVGSIRPNSYLITSLTNPTTNTVRPLYNKHYLVKNTTDLRYQMLDIEKTSDIISSTMISSSTECPLLNIPTELQAYFTVSSLTGASNGEASRQIQNYILKTTNKEYLILTSHLTKSVDYGASGSVFKWIAVFEIDQADNSKLYYKSFTWLKPADTSVLFNVDFKTGVIVGSKSIRFITFDESTFTYIESEELQFLDKINKVVLDTKNQVWICDANYQITILHANNSNLIKVTSPTQQSTSTYPATVNFTLTTATLRGSPINLTVTLRATGGVFSNSLSTITVTTVNGVLIVPVTVQGPGTVSVDITD